MKRILNLFISLFILVSCATAPTPLVTLTITTIVPSQTRPTATITPTQLEPTPTPQITAATTVPCDPQLEDFCITDGHFVFQRPIKPPANDMVDSTYP
ncbi:MAG TPA: hypothetical protein VN843_17135, partial [Anaerolineales bacterium]|nr:hypothetical protein [Anaerolineales bacterium]